MDDNDAEIDLSIVIPAYNEQDRLPRALDAIRAWAEKQAAEIEVIVVDDGSSDATADIVRARMGYWSSLRLISLGSNQGKGRAVRAGVGASSGDLIAYADADLSAPIDQLDSLILDIHEADVALVSRALPGAVLLQRQSPIREGLGKMYALIVRTLLLRGVGDAQCGLKLFRGDFARQLFVHVGESGVIFDTEALLVATLLGGRISQRPAVWSHDPNTRIPFNLGSAVQIALAVLRVKLRHRIILAPRATGPIKSGGR